MRLLVILPVALLSIAPVQSQHLMGGMVPGGPVRLLPSDMAVLEEHQSRNELPCTVKPIHPELGFDLGFHTGYEVTLPLRELSGSRSRLMAIFRVTSKDRPAEPVYLSQTWTVPAIQEEAKGEAQLRGTFMVGQGKYQVRWLLRDGAERYCSAGWQISMELRGKDRQMSLRFPSGAVAPEVADLFAREGPVKRQAENTLNVLVLLHVSPQSSGAAGLRAAESEALFSILRNIAREPRIGTYSIAAFNLDQKEVLYRERDTPQVDFPALGAAIRQLQLGTVSVEKLKNSPDQFLGRLLAEEITGTPPDAVIFIGPRSNPDSLTLSRSLKELGAPRCPVFYLNYTSNIAASPWRDMIGSVVKFWKGFEYTITRPRDLFSAWSEVMSRIPESRPPAGLGGRTTGGNDLTSKK